MGTLVFMIESVLAGLWAGYALAIPVGALAVMLVDLTSRTTLRVGAAAAVGVGIADSGYAAVAVIGGATLSRAVEPYATLVRYLASVVLAGLALWGVVTALRSKSDDKPEDAVNSDDTFDQPRGLRTPPRAFLGFLGLTLVNPWAVIYFSALVLGGGVVGSSGIATVAFVGAVFVASTSWQLLLAMGGSLLGRFIVGPKGRLASALVSAAIVLTLAGRLLLDAA